MIYPVTFDTRRSFRVSASTMALALLGAPALEGQSPPCDDGAAVSGYVRDADTLVGLPGATVTITDTAATILSTVTTDVGGGFRWCASDDLHGSVLATVGPYSSDTRPVEVAAGETVDLALTIDFQQAAPTVTEASDAPYSTGDDGAGVQGTLIDRTSGLGIAGAVVGIAGTAAEALTDSVGRFGPLSAAAGTTVLTVRRLGFGEQRATVSLEDGRLTVVTVEIDRDPVPLEPIEVTVEGTRSPRLERVGFYERKRWADALGVGIFVDDKAIRERGAARISHVLESLPSVRRMRFCAGSRCLILITMAGAPRRQVAAVKLLGFNASQPVNGVRCPADVYINGVPARLFRWGPGVGGSLVILASIDDFVNIAEVAAVEVYRRPSELPADFGGATDGCGAVVIWTH